MRVKSYQRILMIGAFTMGIFIMGIVPDAQAVLKLELGDLGLGAPVLITDNGAGDSSSILGMILFTGIVGNFTINVTTGISKPLVGGPSRAKMDLNSITVTAGTSGGTLQIRLADTSFNLLPGGSPMIFATDIGGVTDGTVTSTAIYDPDDNEFGGGPNVSTLNLGPFGPGAFSGATNGSVAFDDAFSLTQVVTVTLGSNRSASFNATISTPESGPGTLVLLGSGLLVLGTWGRKQMRRMINKV